MPSASVPRGSALGWRGSGPVPPRATMRYTPDRTIVSASPMNRYVGTAKMLPDSRSPRRFATVIRAIDSSPISTRRSARFGTIEKIWSSADDVETATVMT